MRYFLDTEFNEFGGALLSLALVREDGKSLYLTYPLPAKIGPWVAENVIPIMEDCPVPALAVEPIEGAHCIARFLAEDPAPIIISDWPDDVRYFCSAVIVGPGQMAPIRSLTFEVRRIESYPSSLPGAVQHNAWWDAMALRHTLQSSPERIAA